MEREKIIKEMKEKIKEAYTGRDILLIQSEGMTNDLEKTISILFERVEEWYSIYFPELKINDAIDKEKYCKLILEINKENIDESIKKIRETIPKKEKSEEIIKKLETSAGIDLMDKDLNAIRRIAEEILNLIKLKEKNEEYTEMIAREVCPNLSEVGGPKIAAKLIAHVGGLQKLANLPASTIQVLGAEKALFKHLRKKTKPPKHGIIFQHNIIHSAPKEKRGKIARALAAKLAIAAKMDAFGKKFIGNELKKSFEKRVEEIMKK